MLTVRNVEFTPADHKIIVPLFARTLPELAAQAAAAQASPFADLAELRLDPLPRQTYAAAMDTARQALQKPMIVTIRTAAEGGEAPFTDSEYETACLALLRKGGADLLDVEWLPAAPCRAALLQAAHSAGARVIFSEHHFDQTPDTIAMADTLTAMLDAGADIAKLAVMPQSVADAARLLEATARAADLRSGKNLLTMSMGALGAVTRFCGGAFGSCATFGTLGTASAPGQPSAEKLYRVLRGK